MTNAILREAILPRIDGIKKNLKRLKELSALDFDDFYSGDNYDLAQHHMRLALEGVFHISSHILSRMPGGRAVEYKEVARKMGELKIVSKEFADKALVAMAGMRNMLVHNYSQIDRGRFYNTLKNNLADIDVFLRYVKTVLKKPEDFGLVVS